MCPIAMTNLVYKKKMPIIVLDNRNKIFLCIYFTVSFRKTSDRTMFIYIYIFTFKKIEDNRRYRNTWKKDIITGQLMLVFE